MSIFTRLFAPADFGRYALAVALVSLIVVLLTEWAVQPISRFYAEHRVNGDSDDFSATAVKSASIALGLSLACSIALFFMLSPLWGMPMALATAAYVPVATLLSLLFPSLIAFSERGTYTAAQVAIPVLQLVLALALLRPLGPSPELLVVAWLIAGAAVVPWLLRAARRHITVRRGPGPGGSLRRFIAYGLPMIPWFLCGQLLNLGDRYVIEWVRGSQEVGIYSANYTIAAGVAGLLGAPFILAAQPLIMGRWAARNQPGVSSAISEFTLWILAIGILATGGAFVLGQQLTFALLGPSYHEGFVVIAPALFGTVIWYASMIGHKTLEIYERTSVMLGYAAAATICNVLLNILLVPQFGYVAAAYTTLVSYSLYATAVFMSSREAEIQWTVPRRPLLFWTATVTLAALGAAQLSVETSVWRVTALKGAVYIALCAAGGALIFSNRIQETLKKWRSLGGIH